MVQTELRKKNRRGVPEPTQGTGEKRGLPLPGQSLRRAVDILGTEAARKVENAAQGAGITRNWDAGPASARETKELKPQEVKLPKAERFPEASLPRPKNKGGAGLRNAEQALFDHEQSVRLPLRAGSGYAAAEVDTGSAEYLERERLKRQAREAGERAEQRRNTVEKEGADKAAKPEPPTAEEARLMKLLADCSVEELAEKLEQHRQNYRIPLRAGSGYAAAEPDTGSEEYRQRVALERQLENAKLQQQKASDLVVFTEDMEKLAAMTDEQLEDLETVILWESLHADAYPAAARQSRASISNPAAGVGQSPGQAAWERLLAAGYDRRELENLMETYKRSKNEELMDGVRQTAQEMVDGSFLAALGANLMTLPAGLLAGPLGLLDTVGNYIHYISSPSARRYSTLDPNSMGYVPSVFSSAVREETRENIEETGWGGKALGYLYSGTASAIDNLLRLWLLGGPASLGLAGADSFQSTAREVSARGGSPEQAIIMGTISGSSEILTEKFSLDKLMGALNMAGQGSLDGKRRLLKAILTQSGYEVTEEEMNLIVNVYADALVMGENSEFSNQVAYLMESEGCTEAEARNRAWEGLLMQAADTAIESFTSGTVMGGIALGAQKAGEKRLERTYREGKEAMDRVIAQANGQTAPGTDAGMPPDGQTAPGMDAGTPPDAAAPGGNTLLKSGGGDLGAAAQTGRGAEQGALSKRVALIRATLMEEAAYQKYRRDLQTAAPLFGMKPEDFTPELSRKLFESTGQGRHWMEQIRQAERLPVGEDGTRQTLGARENSPQLFAPAQEALKTQEIVFDSNNPDNEQTVEFIGRSVGAKAKNYDVYNPVTGEYQQLAEGTRITQPKDHTIAGKGRIRQIDELDILLDKYGGDPLEWTKEKGYGYIEGSDGEIVKVELHWYEEPTVGRVKIKIKQQRDGDIYIEKD